MAPRKIPRDPLVHYKCWAYSNGRKPIEQLTHELLLAHGEPEEKRALILNEWRTWIMDETLTYAMENKEGTAQSILAPARPGHPLNGFTPWLQAKYPKR